MNVPKLKGKIVENGMTVSELAEVIQVDRATLYRRLANDGMDFTISEIIKIKASLHLDMSDVESIFLS